jgi:hypothetical protein
MDPNSYINDPLHMKLHQTQADQPKRKKYAKKKADTKPTKLAPESNEAPLPEMSQDLNSDLIHYTYRLEYELANTKRKLKFQRKKFKKLIQSLAKYFDTKGVTSKMVDEYIKSISHQLGQESDSDTENYKHDNTANNNSNNSSNNNNRPNNEEVNSNYNTASNTGNNTNNNNNSKPSATSKTGGQSKQKETAATNIIKIQYPAADANTPVPANNINNSATALQSNTVTNSSQGHTELHSHPSNTKKVSNGNNSGSGSNTGGNNSGTNANTTSNNDAAAAKKQRRTKKVKTNDEPQPNGLKNAEIEDKAIAQIAKVDEGPKKYSASKKFEELTDFKNNNDMMKDYFQNNINITDFMKQMDAGDVFKLNALLMNNPSMANPQFTPNTVHPNTDTTELLNNYAKIFGNLNMAAMPEWVNSSFLNNDNNKAARNSNEMMHHLYNNFPHK